VSQPITSAAAGGIGTSPTGIVPGSQVWGFFLDGDLCQMPMVVGVVGGLTNGFPDINSIATGTMDLDKGTQPFEPQSQYAAQYPYNKTITTEGGHVIELDDTPGHERIHLYHKTGSYSEYNPD